MNWLNKLERKFGNWAIPNLIVWLIGAYTIGFVLYQVNPSIIGLLMLSPYHILHGQIWRLITWVFMPTDTNLVYLLIMALFYYQLGTTLERTWGTFRFNVYIFGGMLFTVIGAFLLYGIMYLMNGGVTPEMLLIGTSFSTSYINMSIFLAFACMYPDMQVLLMFIIPIKMKWMAAVQGGYAQTTGICGRRKAQVRCLRQDGTRRSDAGIPFLLQVRGQLRILPGSSVHTSAYSLELESMKKKKGDTSITPAGVEEVSPFLLCSLRRKLLGIKIL